MLLETSTIQIYLYLIQTPFLVYITLGLSIYTKKKGINVVVLKKKIINKKHFVFHKMTDFVKLISLILYKKIGLTLIKIKAVMGNLTL